MSLDPPPPLKLLDLFRTLLLPPTKVEAAAGEGATLITSSPGRFFRTNFVPTLFKNKVWSLTVSAGGGILRYLIRL